MKVGFWSLWLGRSELRRSELRSRREVPFNKNRKWFFRPCHHYIMFSQREMDKCVNSFERNDQRSNFFMTRHHTHSRSPDRLLATTIGFQRYLEQSILSAMKRRGWKSSDNETLWKSSDNDHRTILFGGSDIEGTHKSTTHLNSHKKFPEAKRIEYLRKRDDRTFSQT
jgi:hypothetical protein